MKKFVSLILVVVLSFYAVSGATEEKAEASVVLGAVITAGVSLAAFSAFYTVAVANGFDMDVESALHYFKNKYYEANGDSYIPKVTMGNKITDLIALTTAFVAGHSKTIDRTAVDSVIVDDVSSMVWESVSTLPINTDMMGDAHLTYDSSFPAPLYDLSNLVNYYDVVVGGISTFNYSYRDRDILEYQPLMGRIWQIKPSLPKYINPVDGKEYGNYAFARPDMQMFLEPLTSVVGIGGQTYATARITLDNKASVIIPLSSLILFDYDFSASMLILNTINNFSGARKIVHSVSVPYVLPYVVDSQYQPQPISMKSGSVANGEDVPVVTPNLNILQALSGIADNTDEIMDKMQTDAVVTAEILARLGQLEYGKEIPLTEPVVDAVTGTITYPETITDDDTANPDAPADNSILGWLSTLWLTLKAIPTFLTNAIDTSMSVPMDSIDFSKMNMDGFTTKFPFSIPFDFVHVVSQLKRPGVRPSPRIKLTTSYFTIDQPISVGIIDKYIVVFRWFMLLSFVISLMMLTSKFIRW